jgi:hypothetical protein
MTTSEEVAFMRKLYAKAMEHQAEGAVRWLLSVADEDYGVDLEPSDLVSERG